MTGSQPGAGGPSKVYLWQNDMVMVFDGAGEQIPELQGRLSAELVRKLEEASDGATSWFTGHWQTGELTEEGRKGWVEIAGERLGTA